MLRVDTGIAEEDYVPDAFKKEGTENPPTFKLRPLMGPELVDIQAEFNEATQNFTGRGWNLAIRYGLRGWRNVEDQNGNPVKFSRDNLKFIPSNILIELASRIIATSKFSAEEDGKN